VGWQGEGVQVVSAADPQWIFPLSGLMPAEFRRLVRLVAERGAATVVDGRPGRPWSLPLADRVAGRDLLAREPDTAPGRSVVRVASSAAYRIRRRHSTNGYTSPHDHEARFNKHPQAA